MRKFTIFLLFLTQTVLSQTNPGKIWSEYLVNESTSTFGLTANSFFGSSIANIGDFDNDGVVDFAVGADSYLGTGAVWVVLMKSDFTVKNKYLIQSGLSLNQQDYFGASVTGIGDFDNDGVKDIAVGAPGDTTGGENYGAVYLIKLNSNGTIKSYHKITSRTSGFVAGDFTGNKNFGTSITYLGDFNNDTYREIAVGAPGKDSFKGAVWILSLNSDGTIQNKSQIDGASMQGLANYDGFGSSLAVNSATLPTNKILVGAPLNEEASDKGTGAIYQLSLNPDLTLSTYSKISINTPLLAGALADYDQFGNAVCLAGDIDKNGYNEILAGAYQSDDKYNASGAFFILFMDFGGVVSKIQKISNLQGSLVYDKAAQSQFGSALAPMADMDNNGVPGAVAGIRNFSGSEVNMGGLSLLNFHGNVTTDSVNNNQYTSVKAWGTVNANDHTTFVSFEYRTGMGSWTESTRAIASGSTDQSIGITLSGLQEGLIYQYRVKASNSLGVTYGEVKTFSTQSTIFVRQYAFGLNDGTSWTNAYTDLQSALAQAALDPMIIKIWVAGGTYKPTTGTDRTKSFVMRNNLAIYGGFSGWENLLSQRPVINPVTGSPSTSILSGDIGALNNSTDNSFNIITTSGLTSTAVLDGFVIKRGTAGSKGGGIYNDGGSPIIRYCAFENNSAVAFGGAIYNNAGNPQLENCSFQINSASAGGAIYNQASFASSSPQLINCTFQDNTAIDGGAVYNYGRGNSGVIGTQMVNCTFQGNSGRAIFNWVESEGQSNPQLINCSFQGNFGGAMHNRAIYEAGSISPQLINCVFFGNGAGNTFTNEVANGGSASIAATYSLFDVGVINYGNSPSNLTTISNPFTSSTSIELSPCSSAINAGNNSAVPGGVTTDLYGNPRFYNSGTVDIGAIEYQAEKPTNPSDGGEIASSQTICYGTSSEALTSISLPTGSVGTLDYQWQSSSTSSSSGFENISLATSITYTPGVLTQSTWYRRLSKIGCATTWPASGISNVLKITVYDDFTPGEITTEGETICYNTNPAIAIGNVTSASGGDDTITYSWRSSADSYSTDISGATGSTYTPEGPLTSTTSYRRYAKDGTCVTIATPVRQTWTVTVLPEFIPGEIASAGETICYNTNPATSIGNITPASGGDGSITYSWRSSADGYTTDIASASGTTYTPAGPLTTTTSYRRYARDGSCVTTPTASTGTWTVTVLPEFTPGEIETTGEIICNKTNPATTIGNVTSASGGDGSITYSWRSSADSYATDISGATGSSYTPAGPLTSTTSYRRYAKDATCVTTVTPGTGTWTVTVLPEFTPGAIASTGETICYNTNPAVAIGNVTSASGGDGAITYSWRSSADSYSTDISGATGSTYTPEGPLTSTTSYRRYAKDATCFTTLIPVAETWTVTVLPEFTPGEIATTGETICYNTNPTITIGNVTLASGGDGTITYSWRSSADGYTSDIASATGTTYTPEGPLATTTSYRRYAKDATCVTTVTPVTGTWTVTVLPEFTPGAIASTGETICYNTNPATTIGNITSASGGDGSITYSWRSSADSYATDISGATGSSYTPAGPLTSSTSYRRYAKDATCVTTVTPVTETWTVTVLPEFTPGEIETTGETICYNTNPATTIGNVTSASGGDGSISYSWRSSADSYATDISGATGSTYTPAGPLTSTTSYRRYAKDATCVTTVTPVTETWTVTVSPLSDGGEVVGGTVVCHGRNSTVLTLTGNTGVVVLWQYSTDNTNWTDINGASQSTYTAENLTIDTWFRVMVESSPCSPTYSEAALITIEADLRISGYARYENNPSTPLSGLRITLKKDGLPQGTPVVTGANGFYEFTGLDNGNYSLDIASSHPSGQWQTWGGVNNTDYLLVSRHIAGTQYLPVNPPVVRTSASVKLPHPAINSTDATAIRQAAKFPTTGWSYFDTTKWVFSGLDASTSLSNIVVGCGDVVRDIRGLCAGDVNGSYVPASGYKTAEPGLELVHRGTLPLTDEMIFPVRMDRAMEIGAMTLFLDFDPSVMIVTNVTNVTTIMNGPELWYNVSEPTLNLKPSTLNTLQIGWMSLEPVSVAEGQAVILIHARLRDGVETHGRASVPSLAHPIRFTLNENPLSELANGEGEIIGGAILEMPEAKAKVSGISQDEFILSVFPNPSNQIVHVDYLLTTDKMVDFTLTNSQGVTVMKTDRTLKAAGAHRETFDVRGFMPGVYMLKATAGAEVTFRKVVVVR